MLKAKAISDHYKEQVVMTVFLNDSAKNKDVEIFKAELEKAAFTKSIVYVSKSEAAKKFSEDIGENFLEYLGENPLKNAIDITLKSDFVTTEKMDEIAKQLKVRSLISEIVYDKPLIDLLTKNISKLSFWILLFSALFTVIAVVLINSSIRLSVYSKRFTIKTMQMVGATKGFIRTPFIWKSIQLGVIGAIVAIIGIIGIILYVNKQIPEIDLLNDKLLLGYLFAGIIATGALISWFSTYFATQRFLNLRTDQLYY